MSLALRSGVPYWDVIGSDSATHQRYPLINLSSHIFAWITGFFLLAIAAVSGFSIPSAHAAEVALTWDSPPTSVDGQGLTDLAGFRVYYGTAEGQYSRVINVGLTNGYTVLGLARNTTVYFALSAYDTSGNESVLSGSVRREIPSSGGVYPDDYDGDGIKNIDDQDADNDGLSKADEARLGTSDLNPDSDEDGENDSQELAIGSNPNDPGSSLPTLANTVCADWNGFLGGMWNVYEHSNRTAVPLTVQTTLFDINGSVASALTFALPSFGQFDALVHDFYGRTVDSYGKVCSHHNGNRGDVDGRMVYYKPNTTPWLQSGEFQFAFAMPMTNGKRGPQYLPINNNHGSLALRDVGNLVADWVQITNLGGSEEQGELTFYGATGNVVSRQRLIIAGGGRSDFPAHQLGVGFIGLAEWRPDDHSVPFLLFGGRYHYDNPLGADSFDGALQIEGMYGSGDTLYVPVDTIGRNAVLEISNTLPTAISVQLSLRSTAGADMQLNLPPFGSLHIPVEPIIGPNQIGYAQLRADHEGAIIALNMQYGREWDGGMLYLYGLPAKPALGTELRGSYNTYLDQDSWLVTISPAGQQMHLQMTRPDGSVRADQQFYTEGVSSVYLNQFETPDEYGSVVLVPQQRNSAVSWVLRLKNNEYVIPIPMR